MSRPALAEARQAQLPDGRLVAAVRAGDDRAFEALYARYRGPISSYVVGMVRDRGRAEDLTQDVFLSALRRMRETTRPIAFRPWVYEIARNACIDQFRRGRRGQEVSLQEDAELERVERARLRVVGEVPEDAAEARERLTQLCSAMGDLSDAHRRILVLRELEGLSYNEIGERMGLTRAAVESTLFRARRRLAEEYDELVSGRRCVRVQQVISAAGQGVLRPGDRMRLARHLAHCQTCRRDARAEGVAGLAARRKGLAAQWSSALAPGAEPLAALWQKAAIAVTAVTIAGAGAGVADRGPFRAPAAGAAVGAPAEAMAATASPVLVGPAAGLAEPPRGMSAATDGVRRPVAGARTDRAGTADTAGAGGAGAMPALGVSSPTSQGSVAPDASLPHVPPPGPADPAVPMPGVAPPSVPGVPSATPPPPALSPPPDVPAADPPPAPEVPVVAAPPSANEVIGAADVPDAANVPDSSAVPEVDPPDVPEPKVEVDALELPDGAVPRPKLDKD